MTALHDEITVRELLQRRGLASGSVDVQSLGGGVSNIVLAVEAPGLSAVFKQSLPTLRVAEVWNASQERTVAETAALRLSASLLPGSVPAVIDAEPAEYWLLIERAPVAWTTWKQRLLAGQVDVDTAAALGRMLATLQNATRNGAGLESSLRGFTCFEELRIAPYYRTIGLRHPEFAPVIDQAVGQLLERPRVLVHGDYSPKNVLVGDAATPWLIDFEVAHLGAPAFDVAFLLSHLHLKSIHRPDDSAALREAAQAFWDTYRADVEPDLGASWPEVVLQLACLVLARVDGKSPVEYLDPPAQALARSTAQRALASPPDSLNDLWSAVERMP